MRQPPQGNEPPTLEYRRTRADDRRNSITVRVIGALGSVTFVVVCAYCWWVVDRGQLRIRTFFQPFVLLSLAGAVFCLLVTLGIVRVGNAKDGRS
jgi:hypothetical protein